MAVLRLQQLAACGLWVACAFLWSCGELQAQPAEAASCDLFFASRPTVSLAFQNDVHRATLHAATLTLSVRLLAILAAQDEQNLVFSPYGITRSLGLLHAGARGRTAAQLATVVTGGMASAPLLDAYAANRTHLVAQAKRFKTHTQLTMADAVWGAPGLTPGPAFHAALSTAFGDAWHTVDFAAAPRLAREQINRWVCEQTQGQVPDLIGRGMPSAATRLLLTSTLFVAAPWAHPFSVKQMQLAPFTSADGQTREVPTLCGQMRAKYGVAEGWVAVDLPYRATGLSLTLMWPETGSLAAAQPDLSGETVQRVWEAMAPQTLALRLPKYKLNTSHPIQEALMALGIVDVFSAEDADLGGIEAATSGLHVDTLVHRVQLEVNEHGTQAAAATGIVLRPTAVPEHIEQVNVDHPFLFFMRDSASMTVLFAGRVAMLTPR